MAVIEQISDHRLIVRNSALKWTLAWTFFVGMLIIPAIYFLAASSGDAPSGSAEVPSWVGAVLLVLGLLSICMLLPFTIVTTTRMDKQTDTFVQEHGVLNCVPCSCLPSTRIALSVIERVDVEGYDGLDPDFHEIVTFDRNDDSSSDEDAELKEFYARHGGRRAQVLVHTKAESFPITALTTSGPQCLPCREDRMSPRGIKKVVDRFLGLDAHLNDSHPPSPERAASPSAPARPRPGSTAAADSSSPVAGAPGGAAGAAGAGAGAGGGSGEGSPIASTPAQAGPPGAAEAGAAGVGELGPTKEALEFMSLPASLRPATRAAPTLVTNPAGRPILPHVRERAEVDPPEPPRAAGGGPAKIEVEAGLAESFDAWREGDKSPANPAESTPISPMRQSSWQRIPGMEAGIPRKKKGETEEERKARRQAKKEARKGETPEEKEARKAMKRAKKLRKQLKKAGSGVNLTGQHSTESQGETDAGGTDSEDEPERSKTGGAS